MVKDAEKFAAEDKKRREEIDTRNRLDSMTYEVEKNSKEWSDRLSADHKSKLEAAVERARKALRADDLAEIRAAQEELTRVYGEAGQSLYAQQGATQGAPEGDAAAGASGQAGQQPGGAPKSDDAVEADYEIVDEKK
jgi:molecular chaperone DnaK